MEYIIVFLVAIVIFGGFYFYNKRKGNSSDSDYGLVYFLRKNAVAISVVAIVVVIVSAFFISNSTAKKDAIAEIQSAIEANIDKAYEGDDAVEYGLRNIEVSVDDIGKYLSAKHAYITINCESDAKLSHHKDYVCSDIMWALPDEVETTRYGTVKIKNIIYKPDNDTYGVSIYMNGEQIYKHGKSFAQLAQEEKWNAEFEKEQEFESKYRAYSEYYGAKEYVENNW